MTTRRTPPDKKLDQTVEILREMRGDLRTQQETQTHILRVLERQQSTLDEHVRRTDLAEKALEAVRAELAPLKLHAAVWGALAKIVAVIGTGVGVAAAMLKIFE